MNTKDSHQIGAIQIFGKRRIILRITTFILHVLILLAWLFAGIMHLIEDNSILAFICGITTGVETAHIIYQAFKLKDNSESSNKSE